MDPETCDGVYNGQVTAIIDINDFDEAPDCDCTGCFCDGTMDETTSDWRHACAASCGTTDNSNGNAIMMTCGKWPSHAVCSAVCFE